MLKKYTRTSTPTTFWILWGAITILGLNSIIDCNRTTKLETTIKTLKSDMELMLTYDGSNIDQTDYVIYSSDHENN